MTATARLARTGVEAIPSDRAATSASVERTTFVLIFFLSGACALVYEVSWIRLFAVALGASAYSLAAVLAGFMGGLALGAALAARTTDRRRDALRLYALLELGVSVLGFLSPPVLQWLSETVAPRIADPGLPLALRASARFALATAVLILPTSLMGATLPVLARGFVREGEDASAETARLYSANTLGGALGAFLAGFVLLPSLGLRDTLRATAAVNAGLGAIALAMARRGPEGLRRSWVDDPQDGGWTERAAQPFVIAIAALSGFIALSYEVLWTRLLTFFVGWTVYAYATMLTAFLLGLGLGSALFRCSGRSGGPRWRRVALLQLGTGFAAAASVPALRLLTPFIERCLEAGYGVTFDQRMLLKFGMTLAVMLPACLLLGAAFPATVEAAHGRTRNVARTVGRIAAANTVGAILGTLCATFVLIPAAGDARLAVLALAGVNGLLGAFLLAAEGRRTAWKPATALAILLACLWLGRPREPMLSLAYLWRGLHRPLVLYSRQGVTTTVTVVETAESAPIRRLMVNNLEESCSDPRENFHELLALHGLLLHPRPEDVFVVGLGAGRTAAMALAFPEVRRLDTVELSGEVIAALPWFGGPSPRLLTDPRSHVFQEDARAYLLGLRRRYDLILDDFNLSSTTGSTHLFSREFFSLCRDRLRPDGLFVTEVTMRDPIARTIARTLSAAFPRVSAYDYPAIGVVFLVGSQAEPRLDPARARERFEVPAVRDPFRLAGVEDVLGMLSARLPERSLEELVAGARPVTDDQPHLDFALKGYDNYPALR